MSLTPTVDTSETTSSRGPVAGKIDAEKIKTMFDEISGRYDMANTVLSAGIHHLWRKNLVRQSGARPGQQVLDCATGTGDLAIEFKRAVGPAGRVVGTDFSANMLSTAPTKAQAKHMQIEFSVADAMNLPFKDAEFDFTSISFGIRNVADPKKALAEMARVTKPGGAVLVLEFGQPTSNIWAKLYNTYSQNILPKIGGIITGKPAAYSYLQTSSAAFPCRDEFAQLMTATGRFSKVSFKSQTLGICYIYHGLVKN